MTGASLFARTKPDDASESFRCFDAYNAISCHKNSLLSAQKQYTCDNQADSDQRKPCPARNAENKQQCTQSNQCNTQKLQKRLFFTRVRFRIGTLFFAKQLITSVTLYSTLFKNITRT